MERPWLKSYEKDVPANIQYPKVPLFKLLTESAKRFPKKTATIFYGSQISYEQLDELTNRFAHALAGLGVKKGDRVAVMLPNVPQCVIAYYGILKLGAIVVQTNPLYVERELEHQLNDSDAKVIIALDIFYPRIKNIRDKTPLKSVILTNVRDYLPTLLRWLYPLKAKREGQWVVVEKIPPIYDFVELLQRSDSTPPVAIVKPEEVALLQYTGGTTGVPKGVMLTHANLVVNTYQCRYWMHDLRDGGEVFMGVIPFFHVFGMSCCMNLAVLLGSSMVLLPRFKTDDVLKAVVKYKTTIFIGVQAMYVAINNYNDIQKYDLSSIRVCISGAGPLHVEVQERFENLTKGKLVEGYGLTEASPVTHCTPIYGRRKHGSIGLPFPDTNAKIVDLETGEKEQALGEVGELVIRGPQVMQGYWNKPDETAAVLRNGWLHTGDMAKLDQDGYFFIVDRKKDMIKTRGENVYPREIEEVLYTHSKVKDAVVVGLPEQFSNEVIKAYIVLKDGQNATEQEIIDYCTTRLAKFKLPKMVEFRAELPKTMIGKVLRRVLLDEELKKKSAK
jgi:long-chain acyl-CoA synthetase